MSSSTRRGMTAVSVLAAAVFGAAASVGLRARQEQWSYGASERIFDGAPSRSRLEAANARGGQ
jgi:hypothetical protein